MVAAVGAAVGLTKGLPGLLVAMAPSAAEGRAYALERLAPVAAVGDLPAFHWTRSTSECQPEKGKGKGRMV